jgi:glycosyltransferase involved in cell wall biosynthesis
VVARNGAMTQSLRKADRVIVYSAFTRDQVVENSVVNAEKIVIVAPPLPGSFSPVVSQDDDRILISHDLIHPYILFTGTLEPRKNIPGLLRAFGKLLASGDVDADLVIAGKLGWLSGEITAAIARSTFPERIRWLGYVADEALPALYRHASCFVYPSFAEGYGLPVAEAMACGTPVITSASSGMAEIGDGAAMMIDPRSDAELTAAMKHLLGSHSDRAQLRSLGLRRASAIRAEDGAGVVKRVYAELASR